MSMQTGMSEPTARFRPGFPGIGSSSSQNQQPMGGSPFSTQPMNPYGNYGPTAGGAAGNPSVGLSDIVRQMQNGLGGVEARQQLAQVAGMPMRGPGIGASQPQFQSPGMQAQAAQALRGIGAVDLMGTGPGSRPGFQDASGVSGMGGPPSYSKPGMPQPLMGGSAGGMGTGAGNIIDRIGGSGPQLNNRAAGPQMSPQQQLALQYGAARGFAPFNDPNSGYRSGGPSYNRVSEPK